MNTYNINFDFYFLECTNFKEKELTILRNTFANARIGQVLKFSNYANISFDASDDKHKNPIVTELEGFSRGKTNAIIFNVEPTEENKGKYNKCVVYYTMLKNEGYYGYVFFNTETGKSIHTYNITMETSNLIIRLQESLDSIKFEDYFYAELHKMDAFPKKNKKFAY